MNNLRVIFYNKLDKADASPYMSTKDECQKWINENKKIIGSYYFIREGIC
jgi:hypothetical protein